MWLVSREPAAEGGPASGPDAPGPDLTAYRAAVADLIAEISARGRAGRARLVERVAPDRIGVGRIVPGRARPGERPAADRIWTDRDRADRARAEKILARRLQGPDFAAVLSATPEGISGSIRRLLSEVRHYQPSARSSAGGLTAQIRISLLAQIDALWWGDAPAYLTDADVLGADDLVNLDALRRRGMLAFRYRRQAVGLLTRVLRSAERRAWPGRRPATAGLRFARTRPEAVTLLSQIAAAFAELAPPGTPPLWVTSLTRSVEHQRQLRALGYAAALPSSHCVGYAMDIEMAWFRQFRADAILQDLLLERQRAGEVNVIDEGQAWHVCIRPAVAGGLRSVPEGRVGG